MTDTKLTDVAAAQEAEARALAHLRQLSEEQSRIEARVEKAIEEDAQRAEDAVHADQSPLDAPKTAPTVIARQQELQYLLPHARQRHHDAVMATLQARYAEKIAELRRLKEERQQAERDAEPHVQRLDEARRVEGNAAHGLELLRGQIARARQR